MIVVRLREEYGFLGGDNFELYVLEKEPRYDYKTTIAVGEVVMKKVSSEAFMSPPSVRLSHDAAQQLLDDLWQTGLRPKDWKHHGPEHLEDMRKIAFGFLKKVGIDE